MTTITRSAATRPPTLDLDDRLALASLAMDDRLALATAAVDVNTAHINIDPLPEITIPPAPTAAPCPYTTPIAALLHRARVRLEVDGWSKEWAGDELGRRCPIGAIRVEAESRWQADDACVLLLETIEQHWQADTIPSWNRQQTGVAPVLLALDRGAEFAHQRSI